MNPLVNTTAFSMGGPEILIILVIAFVLIGIPILIVSIIYIVTKRSKSKKTVEQRLAELDGLRNNGAISASEHEERRKAVLGEV